MITRVVDAGLPARWVTGDEVYGADPDLRAQLETLQLGYVLGIGSNRRVTVHGARGGVPMRVDQITRVPQFVGRREGWISGLTCENGRRVRRGACVHARPEAVPGCFPCSGGVEGGDPGRWD
jgi:hypothetical protein